VNDGKGQVMEKIEFQKITLKDPETKLDKGDAVVILRDGRQVAQLPEAARVTRALSLSLQEIQETIRDFTAIMGRRPTKDEKEFWKAIADYKRNQCLTEVEKS
jgi:hypothetical protein